MKRLAIFLDGTWNDPGDNTNVWRLRSMLAAQDSEKNEQLSYYDTGVGSRWYDRLHGGVAGVGLANNIRQAYQWLIEHYDNGDQIYLFGFSRGAFTARSLAGMISKCGLLVPGSPMAVQQLYERYENTASRPIYRLPKTVPFDATDLTQEDIWMIEHSRRVRIKFIGVWDTVGLLGFKFLRSESELRGESNSHFTRLSSSYDHAYQAIAIDEHRELYPVSRWYRFIPQKAPDIIHTTPPNVEQRWFVGAHSNVGGGYRNDPLAQLPLAWLAKKARLSGLHFRQSVKLSAKEHLAPPTDAYAEFLNGFYRTLKLGKRSYRNIGQSREAVTGGWIEPHFESIDASVFEKYNQDDSYRPPNLEHWAKINGVDLTRLKGTQAACPKKTK